LTIVLDASLTVATMVVEHRTADAQAAMIEAGGRPIWVPSLWRLEVANVFRTLVRKGVVAPRLVDECLADLSRMSIMLDPHTDARAWTETLALSREEELTIYDAAYLELALRLDATLLTLDTQLTAAARGRGVEVWPR
jgi:predicted nucleic acid-binding protein